MSTKSTYQLTSEMALRKWRPGDNNTRQSCGPGLYVRGFKSGRKLFQLRYQKSWIDLGDYGPDLPLAHARETALKAKRLLKNGEVTRKEVAAAALRSHSVDAIETELTRGNADVRLGIPTFDKAYRDWFALGVKANRWTHKASMRHVIRSYEMHAQQHIGDLRLDLIKRSEIRKFMEPLFTTRSDTAGKLLGAINEVLERAYDDELIDHNPCPKRRNFIIPKQSIKSAPSLEYTGLPDLWNWLGERLFHQAVITAMKLAVISAQRASTVALMRWEHYQPETGIWTVPAKNPQESTEGLMKSGRTFAMKLPEELQQTIAGLPQTCEYVFSVNGRSPIHPETLRRNFMKYGDITTHGFRNTFKTWALHQDPPIDRFLVDRYTDHALEGLDRHYRRDDMFAERALLAERYLEFVKGGQNFE